MEFWSSRLHKLIDCFGGVWETVDSLPIAFRITSNNAPKFRIFRAKIALAHGPEIALSIEQLSLQPGRYAALTRSSLIC